MLGPNQAIFNKRKTLFELLAGVRQFFAARDFVEAMVPLAVSHPGLETHLHPFKLQSVVSKKETDFFLNTSPEFAMKELLSLGFDKIFSLNWSFRDEPSATHHRPQFLMLEWYRAHEHYTFLMKETEELIKHSYEYLKEKKAPIKNFSGITVPHVTVDELFQEYVGFSILDFIDQKDELRQKVSNDLKEVPLPRTDELSWDDLFFLVFLNLIEPKIAAHPFLLVKEYPAPLSALSTLKADDPRVCERFEVYAAGVELCNCFNELTDLNEQRRRFEKELNLKENAYGYTLPNADVLFNALERGMPEASGNALGVERLLASLTTYENGFYS